MNQLKTCSQLVELYVLLIVLDFLNKSRDSFEIDFNFPQDIKYDG